VFFRYFQIKTIIEKGFLDQKIISLDSQILGSKQPIICLFFSQKRRDG
jgi:hypothetical protein